MIVMRMVSCFGGDNLIKKKLLLYTTRAINIYYINYMNKKPYMVSYNIGMRMLTEVLRGY